MDKNKGTKAFKDVLIESHTKLVIDSIMSKCNTLWRLHAILEDIHQVANDFTSVSWNNVYPKANVLTNAVISVGHKIQVILRPQFILQPINQAQNDIKKKRFRVTRQLNGIRSLLRTR